MSDFASSLPVRTENAGDVIAKIGDATIPSQQLAISAAGEAKVEVTQPLPAGTNNIGDVDVLSLPADVDIRDLDAAQDSVQIKDAGGDALEISAAGAASVSVVDPLPAGTNNIGDVDVLSLPADVDIRDLAFATDKVDVSGSSVSVSALPGGLTAYAEDSPHVSADKGIQILAVRKDTPASLADTDGDYAPLQVNNSGSLRVSVPFGGTTGSAVPTNAGFIGGSDGGTLRGIKVDSAGELQVDVLSQPALSHATDSVKIGDGSDFLAINADGSINVLMQESVQGDDILDYDTTAAVAAAASDNHDYTVTAGKTLLLKQVLISGSGKLKAEIQIETAAASNVFNTMAVLFNSTAAPNMALGPVQDIQISAGKRIRVIRTNKDNQSQDVYSTIFGVEI
jgi:hypothetical protein